MVLGTGFSDFYEMCLAVMKMCYSKQNVYGSNENVL